MVYMCPERQMISLYHDRELSSPWKEKMEAHLDSCEECRAILASYRRLETDLENLPVETIEAAGERVWNKLLPLAGRDSLPVRRTRVRVWNRNVTLPLPAVAAAAVFVIVLFVAFFTMGGKTQPLSLPYDSMAVMGLDDWGTIPIQQDMNEVMRYLSSQDNGDFMVIRLPESRRFSRTGEPALINAADYSRRGMQRGTPALPGLGVGSR